MEIYDQAVESYAENYDLDMDRGFSPPEPVDAGLSTPLFSAEDYQILLREETVTIDDIHDCFDRMYHESLENVAEEEKTLLEERYEFIDPVFDYTITFADNDGYVLYFWNNQTIKIDDKWRRHIDLPRQTTWSDTFRRTIRHEVTHNMHNNERPELGQIVYDIARAHTNSRKQYHDVRQAPMEAITTFEQWFDQDNEKTWRRTPPLDSPWKLPDYFHEKRFLATNGDENNHLSDGYELGHTAANTRFTALQQQTDYETALQTTREHLLYDFNDFIDVKLSIIDSLDMLDLPNYPYALSRENGTIDHVHTTNGENTAQWFAEQVNTYHSQIADVETAEDAVHTYTDVRAFLDAYNQSSHDPYYPYLLDGLKEKTENLRDQWAS